MCQSRIDDGLSSGCTPSLTTSLENYLNIYEKLCSSDPLLAEKNLYRSIELVTFKLKSNSHKKLSEVTARYSKVVQNYKDREQKERDQTQQYVHLCFTQLVDCLICLCIK